jgi:hypothetical protein
MSVDVHERKLVDGNSWYKSIIFVLILFSDTLIVMEDSAVLLPQ